MDNKKCSSKINLILMVFIAFVMFFSLNTSLKQVNSKKATTGSVLFQPSASMLDLAAVFILGQLIDVNSVPHFNSVQKAMPLIVD